MSEKQAWKRKNHHKSINPSGVVWTKTSHQFPSGCDRSRAKPSETEKNIGVLTTKIRCRTRTAPSILLRQRSGTVRRSIILSWMFPRSRLPSSTLNSIGLARLIDNLNLIREANVGEVPGTTKPKNYATSNPLRRRNLGNSDQSLEAISYCLHVWSWFRRLLRARSDTQSIPDDFSEPVDIRY